MKPPTLTPATPKRSSAVVALGVGIVAWLVGVILTPGEVASAIANRPISIRTVTTFVTSLLAAILVLHALARLLPTKRNNTG